LVALPGVERSQKLVGIEIRIAVFADGTERPVFVLVVAGIGTRPRAPDPDRCTPGNPEPAEYRPSADVRFLPNCLDESVLKLCCNFSCAGIV